jgi:hypothetical protein
MQVGTVNYMSPEALIDTAAAAAGTGGAPYGGGKQLMKVGVSVCMYVCV